ncbi:hypothetical protein MHD_03180 [Mannheimia granulomatis]|uniref:Beta-lactamase n=1 Tax=Mannheimia granulomatis TaxID=85402 RepID=A0A011PAC2_9PAST|nr:SEL1-like repeat protein [Mannheimia granulomatis]EXI63294.1 hypothetical protein AK33_01755 [Mannheimia granulomatis]RGE48970.1 hypothetical protein MHD_03180 [Mannheimia granulomatis]
MKKILSVIILGVIFMNNANSISKNPLLEFNYYPFELDYDKSIVKKAPPPRTEKEFSRLVQNAEKNADSAYLLASIYHHKGCLDSNYDIIDIKKCKLSMYYYEKTYSLNNKHQLAIFFIGNMYDFYSEPRQREKALFYYEKAAALNSVMAIDNLFNSYFNGIGVGRNLEKAREYAQKAANLGSSKFQYIIKNWDNEIVPYYNMSHQK